MDFRGNIEASLEQLALGAVEQRRLNMPPEEFRLQWEDSFFVLQGERPNRNALACFSVAELIQLREFDAFVWSLPPESDPMWHYDHLDAPPWPEVRSRADQLLKMFRARSSSPASS